MVVDGDTVRLKDGDADIRLIGLQAPKLSLGRKGFKDWPLADESRAALSALVMDREVTVRLGTSSRDRNGRILAHLVRDDGLWVQGEMLRQGWARLYTFPDNRRLAAEMRAMETEARAERRGIWSHSFFAIRRAEDTALFGDRDTYQIVVGSVVDAARTKDRLYLNFGADFRNDFTVSVAKANWPAFDEEAMDLTALEGAKIEVRGWITLRGGPAIEANHPDQIEILTRR